MNKTEYITFHGSISENNAKNLIVLCSDAVSKTCTEIYIAFSSLGGAIHSGITLFNFLKALPVTITLHNIGVIDSIANIVFLAAANRYACQDSRFLIHGPSFSFPEKQSFNTWQLYEFAQSLKDDQDKMSNIISRFTSITPDTLNKWFVKGETITPAKAIELGIISEIRVFTLPANSSMITVNTQ